MLSSIHFLPPSPSSTKPDPSPLDSVLQNRAGGPADSYLFDGGEEVHIAQGESLGLAQVYGIGVEMHQLGFRGPRRLGTGLGQAVEGHVALPGDVVGLLGGLGVAQDLDEGRGQVLDVTQLCDLRERCRGSWKKNGKNVAINRHSKGGDVTSG